MRRLVPLLVAALLAAGPGVAGEPGILPPPGARLPFDLPVRDEGGRPTTLGAALGGEPAVFTFADFGCTTLCGTALGLAAALLPATGLKPGSAFHFLVLGLDPKDGPAAARAMRRAYLGDGAALASAARFLVADAPVIAAAEAALGYHAAYDAASDRFDHPLALLVLRPDGALGAVLPALGADAGALRAALLQAAALERAPPLVAAIALACRGIGLPSPGSGPRGLALAAALALGLVTALALAGGGVALLLRARRRTGERAA